MQNGKHGKEFLKSYFNSTEAFFDNYTQNQKQKANIIGSDAGELIDVYWKTAKLGKKIRGALCSLGCLLAGKALDDEVLKASLALEHLHSGFLVHDDIMDDDDYRRGILSVHRQYINKSLTMGFGEKADLYGRSMAILAGSTAYFYAIDILTQLSFTSKDALQRALKVFTDYALRTSYGQILDITNAYKRNIDENVILQVLRYKSAEYTGVMPLLIGAIIGGITDEQKLKSIHDYGLAFGWAFQIQDDVLGIFGEQEETGKPVGNDLIEGKHTLLVLEAWKNSNTEEQLFMKSIFGNKKASKNDIKKLTAHIKNKGGYDYAIKKGWEYVEEGKQYISKITDNNELRTILESLIYYMMERTQ